MAQNLPIYGRPLIGWQIPEYNPHERSKRWFIIYAIIALILVSFSIFTPNFVFDKPNYLFVIIIILFTFILITSHFREPVWLDIIIGSEGVAIENDFYNYDTLDRFCVVYKPQEGLSQLYLEFKNRMKPRISIALMDSNPLEVRKTLLKYIKEDLERTDESNSDFLAKILKI